MDLLTLTCWIRSVNHGNVFQVEISNTCTVFNLQKAIKNEKAVAFRDADADDLTLYKPKDPIPRPYKENLTKFILSEHAEPLVGDDKVSELFPEPPPTPSIHIIVDTPLKIDCWLRGSSLDEKCPISIQPGEGVDRLIPRIKDAYPQLRDVSNPHIRFYTISGDEDAFRECLNNRGDGELLTEDPLALNFLDMPVLAPLRVIFEVALNITSTIPPSLRHPAIGGADPIAIARQKFMDARRDKKSPSSDSKTSTFHAAQKVPIERIPCGRPRSAEEVIPVTLLHPVFGQFQDDCLTGTMTEDDNYFAGKLADAMSVIYGSETERECAIVKVFREAHFNFETQTGIPGTFFKMDCTLSVGSGNPKNKKQEIPPFFICEFKNEVGAKGSEPYIQAVLYYLEAMKDNALRMLKSTLPCFLMAVFGPYMVFAGAVWNDRPVVQVLSTPLAFHYHTADTRAQLTVARHLAAFRKALGTLKMLHEDFNNGIVKEHQHDDVLFPYQTVFHSLEDGSTQNIRYTKQLKERGKKKRLFFGTLEGDHGVQICIKFVSRYSKEAHLHCANLGFAPKLRGFEALPGGWYMVVMDDLVGYDLLADLPHTERLPRSLLDDLEGQLRTLHARKLVHGDIRDANTFVDKDRTKLMIIDFDWAGVEDEVEYPPNVNYIDIQRPGDARDGLPIRAAHDIEMLGIITEDLAMKNP